MSDENQIENNTPSVDPEILKEAESQGWVPKERFRGNESDWVDADVFVKRGREILPILRKNNEHLLRDLNSAKEQLKEFREAAEEFKKFQRDNYERKAAEYESKIRELKDTRAQAISDGDGQRVNALDDAIDQAKEELQEAKQAAKDAAKEPTPAATQDATQVEPELQAWLDSNAWFGTDRRMTSMANGIGEALRLEFPALKGKAFLDKLDEALREELPHKFGNAASRRGSAVESGAGLPSRVTNNNSRSYDNLPADAKAACDRFVKQKLMTREEYLADYDWSN